jgi:hypothetical protein
MTAGKVNMVDGGWIGGATHVTGQVFAKTFQLH